MNYTRFLNKVSQARRPSPIRVITALMAKSPPSMISLAAGAPNPDLFPFKSAEIQLQDGTSLSFDETKMKQALQYGPTQGQADLLYHLRKLQAHTHNPPTLNRAPAESSLDICVTSGSQDGLCKAFEMMISAGDNVLVDEPTYSGTLAVIQPLGCNILPVKTDHYGTIPSSLRDILSRWSPDKKHDPASGLPKLFYTIPNGVNPTGASMQLDRKKEIYDIAREYNVLILEDDPYFYLQFAKERVPSYLSLDEDGRVLRFDSFSKILSSGLRIGFVSGPSSLLNPMLMHMQASVMHTTTISQMMVSELFDVWGIPGFENQVERVVKYYKAQKQAMLYSLDKWLTGLAEWEEPTAGMFLWIKLLNIRDTKRLIEEKAHKKQVLLVPGCAFMVDSDAPCPYVRASFSLATPEQIDQGIQRLADLIKEETAQT